MDGKPSLQNSNVFNSSGNLKLPCAPSQGYLSWVPNEIKKSGLFYFAYIKKQEAVATRLMDNFHSMDLLHILVDPVTRGCGEKNCRIG